MDWGNRGKIDDQELFCETSRKVFEDLDEE